MVYERICHLAIALPDWRGPGRAQSASPSAHAVCSERNDSIPIVTRLTYQLPPVEKARDHPGSLMEPENPYPFLE